MDDGAAMTVIFKKKSPGSPFGEDIIVVTDARSNRLLFHQRIASHKADEQRVCNMPLEIFIDHSETEVRDDLCDPQIAICSPSVLSLFADNFDFATRDDFIRGLLINEEILASTIYFAELPTEQYAARVRNWQMYQIVSNDIINRWAYPLVPDMGICCLTQNYIFLRNNVYRNKSVQLARCAKLRENVVVHEKCTIDEGTTIANTVIGRNCKIGRNCVLENAYIFDGVEIAENCVVRSGVIAYNDKLLKGSVVENGSVIGSNVIIAQKSSVNKQLITSDKDEDSGKQA